MGRSAMRKTQRARRARNTHTPTHTLTHSNTHAPGQPGQQIITGRNGNRPRPSIVPIVTTPRQTPQRPPARLLRYAPWMATIAVGIVALAFDLHQLGGVNVWFDEAFSYVFASQPFGQMWRGMWGPEPNMELYYTMLYGWLRTLHLLGLRPTEFLLRLPSALFAALGAMAVFALGKRLGGWAPALIAALLFILNPLQLYYAQQARSYSMEVFFTIAAWYALVVAMETPIASIRPGAGKRSPREERWERIIAYRWWILYAAMVTFSAYTQLFTALMLAAQVIAFGLALWLPAMLIGPWRAYAARSRRAFAISIGAIGVACLPLLSAALHGSHNTWVGPASFGELGRFFLVSISGESWLYLTVMASLCALAITLGLALPALGINPLNPERLTWASNWWSGVKAKRSHTHHTKRRQSPRQGATKQQDGTECREKTPIQARTTFAILVALCWLIAPIALSFLLTTPVLNAHLFLDRYLVVAVPAFCLLAAFGAALLYRLLLALFIRMRPGVASMPKRWLAWGMAAALGLALLVVALPQAQGFYVHADTQGLHTGAPWIEQRFQPGDGIACYPGSWCMLPMTYYLQTEAGPAHFDADSPSDNLSTAALADYGAKHRRVFLIIAVFHPKPGVAPQLIALRRWADAHWKPLGQFTSSHTDYQYIGAFLTTSITIVLYQTGAKT